MVGLNQVIPAAGIIEPEEFAEVLINHKDFLMPEEIADGTPPNWWWEDARENEVILVVNVCGSCSTQTYSHQILVNLCYPGKSVRIDSKSNISRKNQEGPFQQSEFRQLNTSSIVNDEKPMKLETKTNNLRQF